MDDFGRLTRIIRRRWWALLVPALVFFLSALVPAIGTPPQYAVSRTILLTNRSPMNDTGDTLAYDFPALTCRQPQLPRRSTCATTTVP